MLVHTMNNGMDNVVLLRCYHEHSIPHNDKM